MDIIIVGAGVTGVTTAWECVRRGHRVMVVDGASGPAQGASFANGAQISPSESVPWASPHNLRLALGWMMRPDSPFRLRLTGDTRQWAWLARFLANCRQGVWHQNAARMVELALFSQEKLREVRRTTGISYDQEDRGILRIYRQAEQLDEAASTVRTMQGMGVDMRLLDPSEIAALEPALAPVVGRGDIAGGALAPGDETGDAHTFTAALVGAAEAEGVEFHWNTDCRRIDTYCDSFRGIETSAGAFSGDRLILCAGLTTPELTRQLGFDMPIYPLKGYSVTRKLAATNIAPRISVTDESRRMVVSRLGNRIRAAGKADLVGYDRAMQAERAESLKADLDHIYPDLTYDDAPAFWTELRPMTPTGLPFVGRTPVKNLYVNAGHGSLGWTMACGSAALIVDAVEGSPARLSLPEVA